MSVAIVGAGPAGFYLADSLTSRKNAHVEIDLIERLAMPFGLVRFGVAPDHQKIKNVTRVYERIAQRPNVRFFGNVALGRDVTIDDLRARYHQIALTVGAETDRRLGIEGEDLAGSHTATEFVAWYNGHPDYRDHRFDLSRERVAIVGIGNVAVDVARILCRTNEELASTDIADHALAALAESRVREVVMLGRRGVAQAAFTNPEVRELGVLPGASIHVRAEEVALDPISEAMLERANDRALAKKVEIVGSFASAATGAERARRLTLRFLVSPVEVLGDAAGHVRALRLVRNRLVEEGGRIRAVPTDEVEELRADLLFRSVGYRGVPLPGVPFRDDWGIVPNESGRVLERTGGDVVPALYVAGWIKRGPSGVIGTNKPDAVETADAMLEDAARGITLSAAAADAASREAFIRERAPDAVTYDDWRRLDEVERERGEAQGRPRVKLISAAEVDEVLGR